MSNTNSHSPIQKQPFFGIRSLSSRQAKTFLHDVINVINSSVADSCQASTMSHDQTTDCLVQYANGAKVRILIELPKVEEMEDAI